jgi:hypothetical protein
MVARSFPEPRPKQTTASPIDQLTKDSKEVMAAARLN